MSKDKRIPLNICEFDMRWVGDNKTLVFIGARGRGKSCLVLDYLYYNQDIPFCACISPTDDYNTTYRPHIPYKFIFDKYSPEVVTGFLKRQRDLVDKKKMANDGYGDPRYQNVDCRGILIMDDCLADNNTWKRDETIRWIFMNGRHADTTYLLTMQYQVGIPPDLRTNIDYVFICREVKKIEKEKLYKYYAGIFPSFDMFNQTLNHCTRDKRCLVIHCLSESDKIEEQVFWYKAKMFDQPFRVCYDEFWKDNDDYIRSRYVTQSLPKEEDNYQRYAGSKSKPSLDITMYNIDQ